MFEISRAVFPILVIIAGVVAARSIEADRYYKTDYKVVGYEGHTKEIRKIERRTKRLAVKFRRDCKRKRGVDEENMD